VDSAPAARLDMTFRPDTLVANRYLLVRKVGAGGMGSVWAAHDQALDAPCAVKLVNEHLVSNEEVRARFAREAKLAAQLRSPHVVHVFDCGEANGTLYIVMEWLDGESLATRLEREGVLDAFTTYRVVAHVARALTTAHGLGIVHRDLKPDNVFLVPGYDEEIAKVLDFGIAYDSVYAQRDHLTIPGSLLGTPLYLSPEQARGRPVDHRADLWSLAVIVFECLTGSSPFDAPAIGEVMGRILYEPLPKPTDYNSDLSREVDAWWSRAAARKREDRFDSAKEFVDALAEALGVERSLSVPPPGRLRSSSVPGLTRASGIQLPKGGDRGSEPPSAAAGTDQSRESQSDSDGSSTKAPADRRAELTAPATASAELATEPKPRHQSPPAQTRLLFPTATPAEEPTEQSESQPESISPVEAELDESVSERISHPVGDGDGLAPAAAGQEEREESASAPPPGEQAEQPWPEVVPVATDLAGPAAFSLRPPLGYLLALIILMFMAGVVLVVVVRSTHVESGAPAQPTATPKSTLDAVEAKAPEPVETTSEPLSDVPVIRLENLPKVPNGAPSLSTPTATPRAPIRQQPAVAPAPAASVRDYGI